MTPLTISPSNTGMLAWATKKESGKPCWIMELTREFNGDRCGCICPGCGSPLIAVNAGKSAWKNRPHFRHWSGEQTPHCNIVAKRIKALYQWHKLEWLDLPARRLHGSVKGLSGRYYEGHFEKPAERLLISNFDFSDRTAAKLTLADGKILKVILTGEYQTSPENTSGATITILIDDQETHFDFDQANSTSLTLNSECWLSHWDDLALQAEAQKLARAYAVDNFDQIPEIFTFLSETEAPITRETLLHYHAKSIVANAENLLVPEPNDATKSYKLTLTDASLEKRYASTTPDVACLATSKNDNAAFSLAIEITVTHGIDDARIVRLSSDHTHCLEIDLSRLVGRITRHELQDVLIRQISTKRWVVHPTLPKNENPALQQVWTAPDFKTNFKSLALQELASLYKATVAVYVVEANNDDGRPPTAVEQSALVAIRTIGNALKMKGYPQAIDSSFYWSRGVIARILSFERGRGVGYKFSSSFQVLNAIWNGTENSKKHLTTYFIAAKVFKIKLTAQQENLYHAWRLEIKASLDSGSSEFQRPRHDDAFISLLFPEMRGSLAKELGGSSIAIATPPVKNISNSEHKGFAHSNYEQGRSLESPHLPKVVSTPFGIQKTREIWQSEYRVARDNRQLARMRPAITWDEATQRFNSKNWSKISELERLNQLASHYGWDSTEADSFRTYILAISSN
jgi:hypothetical protein